MIQELEDVILECAFPSTGFNAVILGKGKEKGTGYFFEPDIPSHAEIIHRL